MKKTAFGPEGLETLICMNNLASAYRAAGKLDQAVPLFEETLKRMSATLGPTHSETLNTMNGLALAYKSAG